MTVLLERYGYFSLLSCLFLFIAGFLVLFGWAFDISILKNPGSGFSTIKTNVAVALILFAFSLWLLQTRRTEKKMRSIAQICAIIVTLVGFLTVLEYLFGVNLGIDQILFKELPGALYASSPNRMSLTAALALFLLGISLLFLSKDTPRNIKWSQIMALITVFVVGLALIGFIYGSIHFYYIPTFTGIAIYTVLLLFLASLTILFARPDKDFVYKITSNQIGSFFTRRILPFLIIFTIGFAFIQILGVKLGLYDASFGTSLIVLTTLIVYTILFWWFSSALNEIDLKRDKAEKDLLKHSKHLEEMVKQRTAKLSESEKSYRELVDTSLVGVYKTNLNGDIIFANESMAKLGQVESAEDMKAKKITQFYKNPADREMILKKLQKRGNVDQEEIEMVTATGETVNVIISASLADKTVSGMIIDITERKKAELNLIESEERFRMLFERSNAIMLLIEPDSGKIIDANSSASLFYGYPLETLKLMSIDDINQLPQDKIAEAREKVKNEEIKTFVFPHKMANGEIRTVEVFSTPIFFKNGLLLFSIIHDITDREKAENQLKSSLKEKEILLKEIHHRVKNNLQIISSLLDLQEEYVKEDPTAVNVLKESQNRVLSMAMIHEMLYQSKDLSHINFSDYINMMVSNLFDSYGAKAIVPVINVEEISLNIETSVPLGLIISELVSNSLKYAFPEKEGTISIELQIKNKKYELIISDNGVGLPKNIDFDTESTLGLRLVNSLTNQLDGTINLDRSHGTKFTITFKELKYNKRI